MCSSILNFPKLKKHLFGSLLDFDLTKIDAGSTCLGRMIASSFYQICRGAEDEISMKMLKLAFKQGVYKSDTLIDQTEKMKMVQDFFGKKIEQEYNFSKRNV